MKVGGWWLLLLLLLLLLLETIGPSVVQRGESSALGLISIIMLQKCIGGTAYVAA